ncbi:MAG: hypothetical protein FWE13_01845 [Firmicutes bacterium]|nr:hypothetical protein [Bacillota bacterium]
MGKKRVYTYKDITDCFYGYKSGVLFVQIEFAGKKKVELMAAKRLIAVLREKKIKKINLPTFAKH